MSYFLDGKIYLPILYMYPYFCISIYTIAHACVFADKLYDNIIFFVTFITVSSTERGLGTR